MKASAKEIRKNLRELSDSAIAEQAQRFFKTGKGEYGEGDKFLGIRVPIIRKLVGKYLGVSIDEVLLLLRDLENTKLPFIMFSYCKRGGTAYEDIDFGSEWSINRTGGLDFAFG